MKTKNFNTVLIVVLVVAFIAIALGDPAKIGNNTYTTPAPHLVPKLDFVHLDDEKVTIFFSYSGTDQLFLDHTDGGAVAIGKIYGSGTNLRREFRLNETVYLQPADVVKLCNHNNQCSQSIEVHSTQELVISGANNLFEVDYRDIPTDLVLPYLNVGDIVGLLNAVFQSSENGNWTMTFLYLPNQEGANLQLIWFYADLPVYWVDMRTDAVCYNNVKVNTESTPTGWHLWTEPCPKPADQQG